MDTLQTTASAGADAQKIVEEALHYGRQYLGRGKVADYIPALAEADPDQLGITLLSDEGIYYSAGDWDKKFTLQSVSKVMLLVYALKELGHERVFSRVGVEQTGDSFNSIVKLETKGEHPLNPFINAGAIATMGLVLEEGLHFDGFASFLEKTLERPIEVDDKVFLSEKGSGDMNRSLAYFMKSDRVIKGSVEDTLDAYFKMCSILGDTKDLARFGLMLARDGKDLFSGDEVIKGSHAAIVKTLMVTCGMYDSSGEFAIRVGMPAKSGVGGGIMALSQGRAGIGVFSPELDAKGNSLCGIRALQCLSSSLSLHFFKGAY